MRACGRTAVREKKGDLEPEVRTAEQPGQALNIDLCFVPEQHEAQEKLPSVSGSSGHLVIERMTAAEDCPSWPGQVFGEADLTYETAMQQYVQATPDRQVHAHPPRNPQVEAPTRWRQEWEGRAERHAVLQRRQQEDIDWRAAKAHHRAARLAFQQLAKAERRQQQATWRAKQAAWRQLREQRRIRQQAHQAENHAWHERNRKLNAGSAAGLQERSWVAILVVTDKLHPAMLGAAVVPQWPQGDQPGSDRCPTPPAASTIAVPDQ